ncbi:hypothetical protein [Phormidesmis priestleyi]
MINANFECPSAQIDAAICDLFSAITSFSDNQFDASWSALTEDEIEFLIVRLIQNLAKDLDGDTLLHYLQEVRDEN